jgi:hypothetical protein
MESVGRPLKVGVVNVELAINQDVAPPGARSSLPRQLIRIGQRYSFLCRLQQVLDDLTDWTMTRDGREPRMSPLYISLFTPSLHMHHHIMSQRIFEKERFQKKGLLHEY